VLDVLFEDGHLIAVNKPAPLLTQAPPGVPSLEEAVKAYIKESRNKPAGVYLAVPHRLDRPVTGAIVFALTTKAAQRLQAQFEGRAVGKVYSAAVAGEVPDDTGEWRDWLRKVPDAAHVERVEPGTPGGKECVLTYRVERRAGGVTFLELTPTTGRMHQLRVQAAARGFPILGDTQYGSATPFGPPPETPRDAVIALHARRLTLTHPTTKAELVIDAPPPATWAGLPGADSLS
jgi:23S rRNA pseudouridine1911/1915/1917 synthase